MRILIDADGCPVTMEAVKIGNEYGVESIIFCDTSHEFNIKNVRVITVGKGAIIINQNGLIINDFNIDTLLTSRHLAKKARRAGKHLKGPSKRTAEQDEKFEKTLRGILNEHINRA